MIRRGFLSGAAARLVPSASAARSVPARPFGRGAWVELLAANAGKAAIMHFWGMTCAPCLAELPDWGKLLRDRPDTRLIAIAADPTPGEPGPIAATLAKAGLANAEHWTFDGGFSARLYFEVDPTWRGELPRTTLHPATGVPRSFLGAADFSHIRGWLDRQRA